MQGVSKCVDSFSQTRSGLVAGFDEDGVVAGGR